MFGGIASAKFFSALFFFLSWHFYRNEKPFESKEDVNPETEKSSKESTKEDNRADEEIGRKPSEHYI